MHFRVWLAYAVISALALSATLPEASQNEDILTTSPLNSTLPRNVSAAATNTSHLNNVPNMGLFPLNRTSQHPSNYSASLYDLPVGYDLPAVTNAVPQCKGDAFGTNLDRYSCFDAWRNVGLSSQRESWGPRGSDYNFQNRLPYRWSSGMTAATYSCYIARIVDGYL